MDYKIPRKETTYLNQIITVFNKERLKTQKYINGYKIDLYFPDYKLVIECDENDHKDRDPIYEKKRQKYIKKKLDATFIRFNPDDSAFNILGVISKIHYHIISHY